jgi:uncharacterized OsmC-like protein
VTSATTEPTIRNGVNIEQMYGTLDAIKAQPGLARFQFRVSNRWMGGSHNQSTIKGFFGAGQEDQSRSEGWQVDAGEPGILLGKDEGPNPAEYLLHALAACLTTTIAYVASARGVELTEIESRFEGNADVRGALGLSDEVRNGFENIRITFKVRGNASEEKLREIVERAKARSFVYDVVTNGTPVDIDVAAA